MFKYEKIKVLNTCNELSKNAKVRLISHRHKILRQENEYYFDGGVLVNTVGIINFDNDLLSICRQKYLQKNIVQEFIFPDNIELISIEDKLKYNLPTDFIIKHKKQADTYLDVSRISWYDEIKNLSIDNQIKIFGYLFTSYYVSIKE